MITWSKQWLLSHMGEHYDLIDKSDWPKGPWLKEPDLYVFSHHGYLAFILRHRLFGMLNGYVVIPEGHPWYGLTFSDPTLTHVQVHGGVTLAEKGEDKNWYVGFDTNHSMDGAPLYSFSNGTYKAMPYVHEELLSLIRQAEEAGQGADLTPDRTLNGFVSPQIPSWMRIRR